MTTQTLSYHEIAANLPANAVVVFRDVGWDDYEQLLDQIGDAGGRRISYNDGTLQVMSPSAEHESYSCFIDQMIGFVKVRRRINVRSFGSSTLKKARQRKGLEPDACFYVQSAPLIGDRMQLDFSVDPPPDIAVAIDIHHGSVDKFPIYAALGVAEIWHFDGRRLTVHHLAGDAYVIAGASRALPLLTDQVLTFFLDRLRRDGELAALLAFDEWLSERVKDEG